MFCPECGKENPDNAKFCGNCRHPLAAIADRPASAPDSPVIEVGSTSEPVSDLMKYGILVGTLFIPFIGLVMGLIYLAQGKTEEKKSVGKLWLYCSLAIMAVYFVISGDF